MRADATPGGAVVGQVGDQDGLPGRAPGMRFYMSALLSNPAGISLATTVVAMAVLRLLAPRLGLVDRAAGHKRHSGEIPLVLMPPPRYALSLPCADEVSGSAARAVAMTRSRTRTRDTPPRPGCSSRR